MSEFKQIPEASKYEIDQEGNIRTVDKKNSILPYPLGSKTYYLTINDGKTRKGFNVDKLVEQIFKVIADKKEDQEETPTVVVKTQAPRSYPVRTLDENKKSETPVVASEDSHPEGKKLKGKIMKLDTFISVKMWKLYEAGFTEDEIKHIIGPPNNVNVSATIKKYKTSDKLKERASKVKL